MNQKADKNVMIVITEGEIRVKIGETEHTCQKGSFVFVPVGTDYGIGNGSAESVYFTLN